MAEKEYIERGALLTDEMTHTLPYSCGRSAGRVVVFVDDIEALPAADVVEVRHGEWKVVYSSNMGIVYECSECGHLTFGTSDYCICGAKMDERSKK